MARRNPLPSEEALELVAARFRALGDASRLRILKLLMDGEHSVQELVGGCSLSQTNVSRHLGLLRRDGIVARRTDGNRAVYSLVDATVEKLCRVVCDGLADRRSEELEALEGAGI